MDESPLPAAPAFEPPTEELVLVRRRGADAWSVRVRLSARRGGREVATTREVELSLRRGCLLGLRPACDQELVLQKFRKTEAGD